MMTMRSNAVLGLWISVLAACAVDASTAFEGDAKDTAGQSGGGRDGASTSAVAGNAAEAEPALLARDEEAASDESESDAASDAATGDDEPNPFPGVALVSSIAGSPRALVSNGYGMAIGHDAIRVLQNEHSALALARAHDDTLDAPSRAWRGKAVRVVTTANEQCRGHVAALDLATPWIWKDELVASETAPSRTELSDALESSLGSVVARIVLDEPCRGEPVLVEDASRSQARVARTLSSVPRERDVHDAFRKLSRFQAMEAECRELERCAPDDPASFAGRPLDLAAFQFPRDPSVYVVASLASAGCGEWGPPMSAIFKLVPGAAPALYRENDDELGQASLLLDIDDDGKLELVTSRFATDIELLDEAGDSKQAWSTQFIGCSC